MLAVSLAALPAGCGGTQVPAAGRLLRVGLTEYRLSPQNVAVSAGTLTIVAHNYGRLTHNLVVLLNGRAQDSTPPIGPGQSDEIVVSLAEGRYTLASTVQSDQALGVYGTMTVR
jgi:hypothetical protein